jgi:hypothetical protein
VPWLRRLAAGLPPGSIPGQSIWDLRWTKWHWDRFFSEYFGFPLSISLHRCSVTRKRTKNNNHLHLHHRVAQEASRLRCVRSGDLHHLKKRGHGMYESHTIMIHLHSMYADCIIHAVGMNWGRGGGRSPRFGQRQCISENNPHPQAPLSCRKFLPSCVGRIAQVCIMW